MLTLLQARELKGCLQQPQGLEMVAEAGIGQLRHGQQQVQPFGPQRSCCPQQAFAHASAQAGECAAPQRILAAVIRQPEGFLEGAGKVVWV